MVIKSGLKRRAEPSEYMCADAKNGILVAYNPLIDTHRSISASLKAEGAYSSVTDVLYSADIEPDTLGTLGQFFRMYSEYNPGASDSPCELRKIFECPIVAYDNLRGGCLAAAFSICSQIGTEIVEFRILVDSELRGKGIGREVLGILEQLYSRKTLKCEFADGGKMGFFKENKHLLYAE